MGNKPRALLLLVGDIGMLFASFFIMLELAFPGGISSEILNSHIKPFGFVFMVWFFVFYLFNLYQTESVKPTIPHLKKIGIASLVALASSTILFYVVPFFGITPKTNLVIFSGTFIILFLAWRRIFYSFFSSYFRQGLAFVTNTEKYDYYVKMIEEYINAHPQSGYFMLGVFTSLDEFKEKTLGKKVGTLIVSGDVLKETSDVKSVYNQAENVLDLIYAYEDILGRIPVDAIDESWFLHNIQSTKKRFFHKISYAINAVVAFLLLLITLPISIIVGILILLEDQGPLIYSQTRVGKNGQHFRLLKLRSMRVGADKSGAQWTEKNDPRITRVGKVIRKLHIDEIPQFWNIICGDMALVGPRPEIPSFEEKLKKEIRHYGLRNIIAPGFTGWAQIKYRNARGVAESKVKFEYDLYYLKNKNVFMDVGILLRTVIIIFTHN
jgi:lipopolysaccharide/colanic/teichoic acid biosynthesis glycosyltransferase